MRAMACYSLGWARLGLYSQALVRASCGPTWATHSSVSYGVGSAGTGLAHQLRNLEILQKADLLGAKGLMGGLGTARRNSAPFSPYIRSARMPCCDSSGRDFRHK